MNNRSVPTPTMAEIVQPTMGSPDDAPPSSGLSIAQVLGIARARLRLILITLAVLLPILAILIKSLPMSYVATATLIINVQGNDPLADRAFPGAQENTYIPTQIELIRSPVVLVPVIEQLHLTADTEFSGGYAGPADATREVTVRNLLTKLQVLQGAGSQLLYVSVTSKNPVKASNIANAIATQYLDQERKRANEPAGERAARYSEQLAELREKATEAQDRVTAFRQEHGMTDEAIDKSDADIAELNDLEQKLLAAQNRRRDLEAQQLNPGAGADAVLDSVAVRDLRTKLADQKAKMAELRSTLGARHPAVVELQSQMDATQRSLDAEVHSISANYSDQLARARDLESKYQRARDDQRRNVLERRRLQDQAEKLLLELQSAQATYKKALDGYDQILFASAGNYSDVSLVSRADPPVKAEKPNKIKLLLMACVLSTGLAVVWPIAYELLLDRRLRSRDDMERHFGIPLLAEFTTLPS